MPQSSAFETVSPHITLAVKDLNINTLDVFKRLNIKAAAFYTTLILIRQDHKTTRNKNPPKRRCFHHKITIS